MTHCLKLIVSVKDYADVLELKEALWKTDEESGLVVYSLKKRDFHIAPANGLCPFIYFPHNAKDREEGCTEYEIFFDTGSHCDWDDTAEALYCWTFWWNVLKELDALGIEHKYRITPDYEDEKLTLKQAFAKIMHDDEIYTHKKVKHGDQTI